MLADLQRHHQTEFFSERQGCSRLWDSSEEHGAIVCELVRLCLGLGSACAYVG